MIKFFCRRCGYEFSVESAMAGKEIQCPKCGVLADVPTLGELEQIGADGTYRVKPSEVIPEPHHLEEMARAMGRHRDETGEALDMRYPVQAAEGGAGVPDQPEAVRPRYDPESGELITPIDLVPVPEKPNPASIPMAQPVLQYAHGETARVAIRPVAVAGQLLHPANLTAMFFVLLIQLLGVVIVMFPMPGIWLLLMPVTLVGTVFVMAHFANVIEEVGPEERDDLPRLLRNASPGEDVWLPFVRFFLALLYCYAPMFIAMQLPMPTWLALRFALALGGVGTFLFPAVLLTATTSGAVVNLRPDRPWRMIGILGVRYFLVVGLFMATVGVYSIGLLGVMRFTIAGYPRFLFRWPVNYVLLISGIFMAHYFCWILGLMWRGWHKEFPWVLQYYHRPPPVLPSGPPVKRAVTAPSGADRSYTDYRPGSDSARQAPR
jgi:hypothetical protein